MAERFDNPEPWFRQGSNPVYAHDAKQAAKHEQDGYSRTYIPNHDVIAMYRIDAPAIQVRQEDIAKREEEGWSRKPIIYVPPQINMTDNRQISALEDKTKRQDDEISELKGLVRQQSAMLEKFMAMTAEKTEKDSAEPRRGPGRPPRTESAA